MAVLGVLWGHSTGIAADFTDVDRNTVQLWVAQFDEGGIGGFRDAPGRGTGFRAQGSDESRLADRLAGRNMLTLRKLRDWIRGRMRVRYSLCNVRRILHLLGFSSKRSSPLHALTANADTVRRWQADAVMISGTKRRGFTIVMQDKSIFLRTGSIRLDIYKFLYRCV